MKKEIFGWMGALALVCGISSPVFASGSIEITGRGEAGTMPEFASISVVVTSLCYDTSRAAKDANAVLAQKMVDTLKTFARGKRDKVTASGGPNFRQTEYIPGIGGTTRILCERKWRTTNQLRLEIADYKSLPDIQDEILELVDNDQVDPAKVAQTYGEIGQPSFHLYLETATRLRTEAQGKAWQDARVQLDAFKAACAFKDLKLVKVFEPTVTTHAKYAGDAQEAGTPIIPDELEARVAWRFVWEFEPAPGCNR